MPPTKLSGSGMKTLGSFFAKKPSPASTPAPAAAEAAASTPVVAAAPKQAAEEAAPAISSNPFAKRPLGAAAESTAKRPASFTPATTAPAAKHMSGSSSSAMDVEDSAVDPVGRSGETADAISRAGAYGSDEEDARPLASRKAAAPPKPKPSAAPAASPAVRPSPSPPAAEKPPAPAEVKELSFSFLKDKRDANGRRPDEPGYDKTTIQVKLRGGEKFTPGQEQYWEIKKHHQDVVIAFKVGKFYELFEEDALIGHRELDLAFMGKGAPHTGFPEAVLPKYAQKLVELGYKVGIVEQMETPKELEERNRAGLDAHGNKYRPGAKKDKAVHRELCTIVTKGVAFHRDEKATYLLSVTEQLDSGLLGICFVDAATGHVHLGQCADDAGRSHLRTLLAQLRPEEVLVDESRVSKETYTLLRRSVPDGLFNTMASDAFCGPDALREMLDSREYFEGGEAGWPAALAEAAACKPPLALAAFGGCATYLQRLMLDAQLLSLGHMSLWSPSDADADADADAEGSTLVLDAKALENLEVFENSSDHGPKGTLFTILDRCASPFGKRQLRSWLCAPPRRIDEVARRQAAVAALMGATELRAGLTSTLRKLPDLERLLAKVHGYSVAQAANSATHYEDVGRARLAELIKTLEGFEAVLAALDRAAPMLRDLPDDADHLRTLLRVGDGFPDLRELLAGFRAAFDWNKARADGRVVPLPGADDVYDGAKADVARAKETLDEVKEHWRSELRDRSIDFWSAAGSPTEPFQLAVSEATLAKRGTPEEFTQMSSKKGTRRFWTDEIRHGVRLYLDANERLERSLTTGARRLYGRFTSSFALWHRAVSVAAEIDCLLSLAAVSSGQGMCRPAFVESTEPFLSIRAGVNICVQASLAGEDCIPNDIVLGTDPDAAADADASPPMLLVTGPNMGGKSTLLRQACLTVLMAHLGCWVPADACRLSVVDRIFTRVGANDAIMAGLSTFRVELEETAAILRGATRRSLVILDELGRGTATFDGMAIAHSVLGHLIEQTRCRSLFATHYHALTRQFELPNPQVGLYHMACVVDDETRHVTFLYKFAAGACNRSHGVNVARLAGLPESLLSLASQKSAELEGLLEQKFAAQHARRVLELQPGSDEMLALWREVRASRGK